MGLFERERQWNEKLLKLHEEKALDLMLSIVTNWTNENMQRVVDTLTLKGVEHFKINKSILHPTKDIGPKTHEKHIRIRLLISPLKTDEIIKALQKIGKTEIDCIQSGMLFLTESHDTTFLLKEEEP